MQELLLEACVLWHTDPSGAADRLEKVANELLAMAKDLRNSRPGVSPKGFSDRVLINVIGPEGIRNN